MKGQVGVTICLQHPYLLLSTVSFTVELPARKQLAFSEKPCASAGTSSCRLGRFKHEIDFLQLRKTTVLLITLGFKSKVFDNSDVFESQLLQGGNNFFAPIPHIFPTVVKVFLIKAAHALVMRSIVSVYVKDQELSMIFEASPERPARRPGRLHE